MSQERLATYILITALLLIANLAVGIIDLVTAR